jgi:SAM-dependent methyltransferase
LGDVESVVNVGAGTGSYEPTDRFVVAVEPSMVMLTQRPPGAAPVVRATAEALPFRDRAFDGAMALLTIHHWDDQNLGLGELRRVAMKRVVVLTISPDPSFWLTSRYFPAIAEWDALHLPAIDEIRAVLGGESRVIPVPIPHNCRDGFLGAFWRRPEAYLDPRVRAGISTFSLIRQSAQAAGLRRLRQDLMSGAWTAQFGDLLSLDELDLGYRLVVAEVV